MQWIKQGLIFEPPRGYAWMVSHAALPVAQPLSGDLVRVYFCSRDSKNRAQIGYFEMNLSDPRRVLRLTEEPVIGLGALGTFDDSGVTSSWCVQQGGRDYHYYTGWSLGVTVPFYFYIGLAISEDGGLTFHRVSPSPILGRDEIDPYLTASPCVLVESGVWRMWYVSGVRWDLDRDQPRHYYHIKYAESHDGIRWQRQGIVCIDFQSPNEYALARPCVLKDGSLYRMWYCYRGDRYRIGYAESRDGLHWERHDDQAGIEASPAGWDAEMVAYPFVFDHNGQHYMLYNGNGYGKTGIGLAVLASA